MEGLGEVNKMPGVEGEGRGEGKMRMQNESQARLLLEGTSSSISLGTGEQGTLARLLPANCPFSETPGTRSASDLGLFQIL